jgi:hypothetical protein
MSNIFKLVSLYNDKEKVSEKMKPFEEKLKDIHESIKTAKDNLTFEERNFINNKLIDNFSETEIKEIEHCRKLRNDMLNGNAYYALPDIFDPYYDKYDICDIQKDGNKMRIGVSCLKQEGSISGMVRFLKMYYTTWFYRNELKNI